MVTMPKRASGTSKTLRSIGLAAANASVAAFFASYQSLPQCFHLLFMLFEKPEAGTHNFARIAVAASLDLATDETLKVIAEGDTRVLCHKKSSTYQIIPLDGKRVKFAMAQGGSAPSDARVSPPSALSLVQAGEAPPLTSSPPFFLAGKGCIRNPMSNFIGL